MANDWKALAVRFKKESARTGISVKEWCKIHGLNLATARRHIKPPKTTQSVHKKNPKRVHPKKQQSVQNGSLLGDDNLTNQEVTDSENNTHGQELLLKMAKKKKLTTPFVAGNQCARKYGHYSEFVTTEEDAARYASSGDADCRDELHLTRMQNSNILVAIANLERKLAEPDIDDQSLASYYESYAKFQTISGIRVKQIESLSNSLESQLTQQANRAKTVELTRKTKLEADKISRDSGDSATPLDDIYDEILALGSDGMMNKY